MREDRKRISPTYDLETYKQIEAIAHKEGKDLSDVVRDWSIQGLNGSLMKSNLEIITPIIREQVQSIMEPMMERQIALTAKTCVQAGTAAYLSADAILKFVPKEQREEVRESYEKARKQAVTFLRSKIENEEK